MFEYIKGQLEAQSADTVVIENNGIGYRVCVSLTTIAELPPLHEKLTLLLYPAFREDDVTLYGFATEEERGLFGTLIGISGIGPKAAMGLLSQFAEPELIRHIVNADAKAIARAPGIGRKTAERIILELKDKYKDAAAEDEAVSAGGAMAKLRAADNLTNEGVNGLLGLGYTYAEASDLVARALTPDMTIEELLTAALALAASGR
ncbi:Holliday junction branch migration protein RuvA [Pseudoramibacter alactolyticus]